MKFASAILLLACVGFAASKTYTLPDLGVTTSSITCSNYASLLKTAKSDKANLEKLVANIPKALVHINKAVIDVETICADEKKIVPLTNASSFLQRTSKHMKNPQSFLGAKVSMFTAELEKELDNLPEGVRVMIQERLHETFTLFNQLSTKGTYAADCKKINAGLKDLYDYLDFIKTETQKKWIDKYLTNRISTLSSYSSKCTTKPAGCNIDEAKNALGPNRCTKSSQCAGNRTCSSHRWCQGTSGC